MNEQRQAIQTHIDARNGDIKTVTALHKSYSLGGEPYKALTEQFVKQLTDLIAVRDSLVESLAEFPESPSTESNSTP